MLRRGGGGRLPEPRLDVPPPTSYGNDRSHHRRDVPEISTFIMDDVEDLVGETLDRSSYCETVEGFYVNFRSTSIRHLARINETLARDLEGARANVSSKLDDFGQALFRLSVKDIDPSAIYDDDDDEDDRHHHHYHHHHRSRSPRPKRTCCANCGARLQGMAAGVLMSAALAIYLIFFK